MKLGVRTSKWQWTPKVGRSGRWTSLVAHPCKLNCPQLDFRHSNYFEAPNHSATLIELVTKNQGLFKILTDRVFNWYPTITHLASHPPANKPAISTVRPPPGLTSRRTYSHNTTSPTYIITPKCLQQKVSKSPK